MRLITRSCLIPATMLLGLAAWAGSAGPASDPLREGFANPPSAARPRVWWHWMNGNITKEGIRLDLEWMQRTGIGGFQNFDAALGTPQVVEKRLVFMTPEWQDAFAYAMRLADELGLEAAIAGSPGWSESGGPWVQPGQAMKKVVWSETVVEGGRPYTGTLPHPPVVGGPLLDAPLMSDFGFVEKNAPQFYADTHVLAFPEGEAAAATLMSRAQVSGSGGSIDASRLADGSIATPVELPIAPPGGAAWIRFDFAAPETVRALVFSRTDRAPFETFNGGPPGPQLQASEDGEHWRTIAQVPGDGAVQHTLSFPAVTARHFRAWFATQPAAAPPLDGFDFSPLGITLPPPATHYHVSELRLEAGARIQRAEEKAGFGMLRELTDEATPAVPAALAIRRDAVIDLTARRRADGSLDWTPPPGRWRVLRFGYSLTGKTNHPASPEGTGLEVDKLSAEYVRDYMQHYLDLYAKAAGGLMGRRGLTHLISDSYEAGAANWTGALLAEFRRRRGYDPLPWLPALTGRVVESAAASDKFLWDYRRTLADLIAENHYEQITDILRARGMGHYGESHESGRVFIGDGMEAKRSNEVPMAAMWTQRPGVNADQPGYNADIRESASVAHLYGQNLVAAESLTAGFAPWQWSPATLKPTADKELAMGLNRFVIHTSVHQPFADRAPGLSLGPFGQWFTRHETWSGAGARAWVDYLARSSFLLQQGHFVADIAWYYGEDSNVTALYGKVPPPIPPGYNFDYVNADALVHRLAVKDGELVTGSGMRYRVLALDPRAVTLSLPVLRRIRDLVAAGGVVAGAKPVDTPSLADDEQEFRQIADALWGDGSAGVHRYGRGHIHAGAPLAEVLRALDIAPDFSYPQAAADTELLFVHRRLADGDLYFVNNRRDRAESLEVSFRVTGRAAELWHADTGRSEPASYRMVDGRTRVNLQLDPWDAVFVVFRERAQQPSRVLPARTLTALATLAGPWNLSFQPGRGAPADTRIDQLVSWSTSADRGIRYFSGTGTYTRTLEVPADWLAAGAQLWLDLGEVRELAEVSVNGRSLGVAWKPPYRVNLTDAVHAGANRLAIAVTNLWPNRLIGDAQPDATTRYTLSVPQFYRADAPLLSSGLLGPVRVLREQCDCRPAP
ncbi:MAG: glycoside hydrolase [Gammaproteobacteria bacterium]|nr:glycoside hydrolase [Gammaproteobacteria bacterium]